MTPAVPDRQYHADQRTSNKRAQAPRGLIYDPVTGYLSWVAPAGVIPFTHYNLRHGRDDGPPLMVLPQGTTTVQILSKGLVRLTAWNDISRVEGEPAYLEIGEGWAGAYPGPGEPDTWWPVTLLDFIPPQYHDAIRDGTITIDLTGWVQEAIDAVAADNGGALHAPWGTYPIRDITLRGFVEMQGDGMGKTIFKRWSNLPSGRGMFNIDGSFSGLRNLAINGMVVTPMKLAYSSLSDPMAANLTDNTSIWMKGGATDTGFHEVRIYHTGGRAIIADARNGHISRTKVKTCLFENNRPHLFGVDVANANYGSWTGGIHYQGDGYNFAVHDLHIDDCTFRRGTGNQVHGHLYEFSRLHTEIKVTNSSFVDIGRDGVLIGGTSGGVVSGNTFRRIGYICLDDTGVGLARWNADRWAPGSRRGNHPDDFSPGTPAWISNQWAVGLDSAGLVRGVNYSDNSFLNCLGAAMDGDGYAEGTVSGNTARVSRSDEPEFTEDQVATWPKDTQRLEGTYCYGFQLGNTSLIAQAARGVTVKGNYFFNLGLGALRMYCARKCNVSDNHIFSADVPLFPPIALGNVGTTNNGRSYDNTVHNNTIYYNPPVPAAAIFEDFQYGAFDPSDKNWVSQNRIFGNQAYEFKKAPATASVTGVMFSSMKEGLTSKSTNFLQREDGYLRMYAGTDTVFTLTDTHAIADIGAGVVGGPLFNVSRNAVGGAISTGARTTLGIDDVIATGVFFTDQFLAITTEDPFNDTRANLFDSNTGLMRYDKTNKKFQVSVAGGAGAGARIWIDLAGGTGAGIPGGPDQSVQWNNNGVFGGDAGFSFNRTSKLVNVTNAISTGPRTAIGLSDVMATGILWGGTFLAVTNTEYSDPKADALEASVGLLRYDANVQRFQISTSKVSGARVWSDLVGGTGNLPGAPDQSVQWNNNGSFGGDADFVFNRTSKLLLVTNQIATGSRAALPFNDIVATGVLYADSFLAVTNTTFAGAGDTNANMLPSTTGLIRYDATFKKFQISVSGGAGSPRIWTDLISGAGTPGTPLNSIQFNRASTFGGSANLLWDDTAHRLDLTGLAATKAIDVLEGWVESKGGFRTISPESTAVNAPYGGVTAVSLISIRNDQGNGLTLARTAANAQQFGFSIDEFGKLWLRDDTWTRDRMTVWPASNTIQFNGGDITFSGAGNIAALGTVVADRVRVTKVGDDFAVEVMAGGIWVNLGVHIEQALYLKPYADPLTGLNNPPTAGYGGLAYKGGTAYRIWNGTAWVTVDFGAIGVTVAPGGPDQAVQWNNGGVFGGDADMVFNRTSKLLLVAKNIATGSRGSLPMVDLIATGVASADNFYVFGDSTYDGNKANLFDGNYGLMRFDKVLKKFQISDTVSGPPNARVWKDLYTGGGAAPGGVTNSVQYKTAANSFGGDDFFKWDPVARLLTVTGDTNNAPSIYSSYGWIQSEHGFYSPMPNSDNVVNVPNGGVYARNLVSVRDDAGPSLKLVRTAVTPADFQWRIDSNGAMVLKDAKNAIDRLTLNQSGTFAFSGDGTNGVSISSTLGFVQASANVQAPNIYANGAVAGAFQAFSGGIQVKLGVQAGQALYLKAYPDPATGLNSPPTNEFGTPATFGGLAYKGGTEYRIWNGSAWVTVNFASIGSAAVTSVTGTVNRVTASPTTGAVVLNLPQDIHTAANPTFQSLYLTENLYIFNTAGTSGSYFSIDGYNNWLHIIAGSSTAAAGSGIYLMTAPPNTGNGSVRVGIYPDGTIVMGANQTNYGYYLNVNGHTAIIAVADWYTLVIKGIVNQAYDLLVCQAGAGQFLAGVKASGNFYAQAMWAYGLSGGVSYADRTIIGYNQIRMALPSGWQVDAAVIDVNGFKPGMVSIVGGGTSPRKVYIFDQLLVGGSGATDGAIRVEAGYIDCIGGFYSGTASDTIVNVKQGGVWAFKLITDSGLLVKSLGGSSWTPPGGYTCLIHNTGTWWWTWNGSGWVHFDITAGGGATVGGTNEQVQWNNGAGAFGADSNFGWRNSHKSLYLGDSYVHTDGRLTVTGRTYLGGGGSNGDYLCVLWQSENAMAIQVQVDSTLASANPGYGGDGVVLSLNPWGGQVRIGSGQFSGANIDLAGSVYTINRTPSHYALQVRGAPGQAAQLFAVLNNAGALLSAIDIYGNYFGGIFASRAETNASAGYEARYEMYGLRFASRAGDDGAAATITHSQYEAGTMCYVGVGAGPNRFHKFWDRVQITGPGGPGTYALYLGSGDLNLAYGNILMTSGSIVVYGGALSVYYPAADAQAYFSGPGPRIALGDTQAWASRNWAARWVMATVVGHYGLTTLGDTWIFTEAYNGNVAGRVILGQALSQTLVVGNGWTQLNSLLDFNTVGNPGPSATKARIFYDGSNIYLSVNARPWVNLELAGSGSVPANINCTTVTTTGSISAGGNITSSVNVYANSGGFYGGLLSINNNATIGGVLTANGSIVSLGSMTANKYYTKVSGVTYTGQDWEVYGSFVINGGSYSKLTFRGGILVGV